MADRIFCHIIELSFFYDIMSVGEKRIRDVTIHGYSKQRYKN